MPKIRVLRNLLAIAVISTLWACDSPPERTSGSVGNADRPLSRVERDGGMFSRIDVSMYAQEQVAGNWCWAACVATTINCLLEENAIDQPTVVRDIFGGKLPDVGAYEGDIVQAINGRTFIHKFEYGNQQILYKLRAWAMRGLPPPDVLSRLSDRDQMAIVLIPRHAVVLFGAYWSPAIFRDRGDPVYNHISVWDPWPRKGIRDIKESDIQGMIFVSLDETPM